MGAGVHRTAPASRMRIVIAYCMRACVRGREHALVCTWGLSLSRALVAVVIAVVVDVAVAVRCA